MKWQRMIITVLICLSAILSVQKQVAAAPAGTPLQKQIKVEFTSTDQLNQIRSMNLDIWKIYSDHVIAAVDYDKVDQIQELGFSVEVISDDAWGVLAPEITRPPSKGTFGSYRSHDEVEAMLRDMESSGVAKVYDIGDSIESRDIWAIRISDNPTVDEDEDEPSVLFVGCHHAREWISVEVSLYIADYLTANYATNPEIQSLVDNQQVWVVPVLNPDGYEYTRSTNRGWRKNRRNNGDGTYGVDLNRNYGYMWGYDDEGSSPYTDDYDYRGTAGFSEPETQALRDLCLAHEFRSMITYHSYGGEVAYVWGYTWDSPPDYCRDRHMADVMRDLMNAVHGAGYTSDPYGYLTNGDTTDWTYGIFRMPSITIELRPTGSSGGSGFELPEDEIIPTCEENLPAALYLIKWNEADLNSDNIVNLPDLAILSSYWLWPGDCNLGNICCNGADIFGSNTVDMIDLAVFAGEWCTQSIIDTIAPRPDPMTFSSLPAATGDSSIVMTASAATDISGVQYYFDCNSLGCHDSSWQDSRTYEDTGLSPLTEYTYTVTARDKSASRNETAASNPASATTDPPDTTPPIPSPMTWDTAPNARSSSVISMTATTASDSSGVQYFFDCITAGGHDSGWQDSRTYEDTGLLPVTEYTYTVTARDKSVAHNPTAASDPASATTSHEDNVVLPANGGNLDSFTSEYGSGWVASDLTNEVTNEDGWSSASSPEPRQEFIYSFQDGKDAALDLAVIHGGTAEGQYYSKDVEVWTSANGTSFTLAGSDTLLAQGNDSVTIDLGSVVAKKVKLRIESGYRTDYWELAEFEVYGEVID